MSAVVPGARATPAAQMSARGDRERAPLLTGHLSALDGLRAVAIAGVLAQHAGFTRLLGAAQGVTVFFVVSGFLISSLLLTEYDTTGRIGLLAFYRRRFARLMPAFLLALVVTSGYLLARGVSWAVFWSGPVTAMLYVINIAGAHDWLPSTAWVYFVHNWSLAIEEQFYLLWPTVLVLALRRRAGRRFLAWVCVAVVAVAQLLRLWLTAGGAPFARINFATETRIDAVMIGCLLALALSGARPVAAVRRWATPLLVIAAAVLALVAVQGAVVRLDPGGYLSVALAAAAVVAVVVVSPTVRAARLLAWGPLVWVGRLSYGLYLWNVLLVQAYLNLTHGLPASSGYGWIWLLACLVVSQLSYSWVEAPLRRRLRGRPGRHAMAGARPARTPTGAAAGPWPEPSGGAVEPASR